MKQLSRRSDELSANMPQSHDDVDVEHRAAVQLRTMSFHEGQALLSPDASVDAVQLSSSRSAACAEVTASQAEEIQTLSARARLIGLIALSAKLGELASFGLGTSLAARSSERMGEVLVYLGSDLAVSQAVGDLGSVDEIRRAMLITWRNDLSPYTEVTQVDRQGRICPNIFAVMHRTLQRILNNYDEQARMTDALRSLAD